MTQFPHRFDKAQGSTEITSEQVRLSLQVPQWLEMQQSDSWVNQII